MLVDLISPVVSELRSRVQFTKILEHVRSKLSAPAVTSVLFIFNAVMLLSLTGKHITNREPAGRMCSQLEFHNSALRWQNISCGGLPAEYGDGISMKSRKPYLISTVLFPDSLLGALSDLSRILVEASVQSDLVVLKFDAPRCPQSTAPHIMDSADIDTSTYRQACDPEKCNYLKQAIITYQTATVDWWNVILRGAGLQPLIHSSQKCELWARPVARSDWCGCACTFAKERDFPTRVKNLKHNASFGLPSDYCSSCALVLNSGILASIKNPSLGPMIDAHGCVVRVNNGPAGGKFERIAGTKTHIRVGVAYEYTYQMLRDEVALISTYTPSQRAELMNLTLNSNKYNMNKVYEVPKYFHDSAGTCLQLTKGKWPSTGLTALLASLRFCEQVTVFGKSISHNTVDMSMFNAHYFENVLNDKYKAVRTNHDWVKEQSVFRHLVDVGVVTVVP